MTRVVSTKWSRSATIWWKLASQLGGSKSGKPGNRKSSVPGPLQVWWSAGDRRYNAGSMRYMKTLSNPRDKNELLLRFANVRADSQPRWGAMSAHEMICHLSDSFRVSLGEKHVSPATSLLKRTLLKWFALWVPLRWPHGFKTLPEKHFSMSLPTASKSYKYS